VCSQSSRISLVPTRNRNGWTTYTVAPSRA